MKGRDENLEEDAGMTPFHVAKGVLSVHRDLYWELLEEFESACDTLLSCRKCAIVLDLTAVNFISSSFVGGLGNFVVKASRLRKKIVLKVTRDVSWLFDILGSQENMVMEIV